MWIKLGALLDTLPVRTTHHPRCVTRWTNSYTCHVV